METKLEQIQRWSLSLIKDAGGELIQYHEALAVFKAAYQQGLADNKKCSTCDGVGEVPSGVEEFGQKEIISCPDCRGVGKIPLQEQSFIHPTIPVEIRKTLWDALESTYTTKTQIENEAAREWLAKCSTATDKAVCPKCGGLETIFISIEQSGEIGNCVCRVCRGPSFLVQVLAISPPREPKDTL